MACISVAVVTAGAALQSQTPKFLSTNERLRLEIKKLMSLIMSDDELTHARFKAVIPKTKNTRLLIETRDKWLDYRSNPSRMRPAVTMLGVIEESLYEC